MHPLREYRGSYQTRAKSWAESQPLSDLLRKQREGKLLTREEKEVIKREAEAARKRKLCKK